MKRVGKMNKESLTISSLGEFINAIKRVSSGTALYRQIIRRFINKVEIESTKKQGNAWEYYSSIFLMREAQNIYFALGNFIDRFTLVEKRYLLGIYNRIYDSIKKYCKSSDVLLKDFPDPLDKGNLLTLLDFQPPEEKRILPVRVYYRGEVSKSWRTLPSVFREISYNSRESFYYHEVQARVPKEFENLSHLDKLVTMQHYETPTRLLDLTSNPLNALYFACERQKDISDDGRVTLFPVMSGSISYGDSDKALILSSLAPLSSYEKFSIWEEINKSHQDIYNDDCECVYLNKLFLEICSEKPAFQRRIKFGDLLSPLFVQPNMINSRITNQQGAFLLSGLTLNDDEAEEKIKDRMSDIHLIIPADKKVSILRELDSIGINQATIYPNLDKVAGYLKGV
jgi:hypothetical protein